MSFEDSKVKLLRVNWYHLPAKRKYFTMHQTSSTNHKKLMVFWKCLITTSNMNQKLIKISQKLPFLPNLLRIWKKSSQKLLRFFNMNQRRFFKFNIWRWPNVFLLFIIQKEIMSWMWKRFLKIYNTLAMDLSLVLIEPITKLRISK